MRCKSDLIWTEGVPASGNLFMMKCNCHRKCVCLRLSLAGGLFIGGLIGEGVMFNVIDLGTWSRPSSYILLIPWSDAVSCHMRAAPRDLLIQSD